MNSHIVLRDTLPFIVLIPLIFGTICTIFSKIINASYIALVIKILCSIFAIICFVNLSYTDEITYYMGDWIPPYGIEYRIDLLSNVFLLLISIIGMLTIFFSIKILKYEVEQNNLFIGLFLICVAGYLGIVITNDLFNLYVFLEISSIASYALVAAGRRKFSSYAAFKYLVFGTIAATFILFGIGLIYMNTGTLNMSDINEKLSDLPNIKLANIGLIFIVIGCLLKSAVFPLHSWLLAVYENAPSTVVVFLSAIASKVMIYIILRLIFFIYPNVDLIFNQFLAIVSIMSIFAASYLAIIQINIHKILVYSSISNIGYVMLAIALNTKLSFIAAIIFIINHSIIKSCLFMIFGAIGYRLAEVKLTDLKVLTQNMPWLRLVASVNMLAIFGLPLTAGFISKWSLIEAVFSDGQNWLVAIIIIGSILSLIYCYKVVKAFYFSNANDGVVINSIPLTAVTSIVILTFTNIVFGVNSFFSFGIAEKVANLVFR